MSIILKYSSKYSHLLYTFISKYFHLTSEREKKKPQIYNARSGREKYIIERRTSERERKKPQIYDARSAR